MVSCTCSKEDVSSCTSDRKRCLSFSVDNGDEGGVAERAGRIGLRTLDMLVDDDDETVLRCS